MVHPHFRCSLEMPLTLTVKYVNEHLILSLPNKIKYYILLILLAWVQYAIFGKVTKGDETLKKLEELPTRREGIFVMVWFHFNCFNIQMSMVDFSFLQNWYRTLLLIWYFRFKRKIRRGVGGNSDSGGMANKLFMLSTLLHKYTDYIHWTNSLRVCLSLKFCNMYSCKEIPVIVFLTGKWFSYYSHNFCSKITWHIFSFNSRYLLSITDKSFDFYNCPANGAYHHFVIILLW